MVSIEQVLSSINFQVHIAPMILYIIGIVIYALIIWYYYQYIGRRDLFKLNWEKVEKSNHKKSTKAYVFGTHILKYLVIFPVITFLWFGIIAVLLIFMSKSQGIENILMISMTLVVAVRVLAYYREELAKEVAKLLPLAILGLFIVDPTYFSWEISLNNISRIPDYWVTLLNYLLFAVLLEFILRLVVDIKDSLKSYRQQKNLIH
jgi:hypothetical protein